MSRVWSDKENFKNLLRKIPLINSLAKFIYFTCINPLKPFSSSDDYWKQRYKSGGTSGPGSYDKMAEFKAEIINGFIKKQQIQTVVEFGCGDGNQLALSDYPLYLGFDISPEAIICCEEKFINQNNKSFRLLDNYSNERAEVALSLDVIYHLVEDEVYNDYMQRLFGSSEKFVIIYSSNSDKQFRLQAQHVKNRKFSKWIGSNDEWKLKKYIPNRYPYKGDEQEGTISDFYIYEKTGVNKD